MPLVQADFKALEFRAAVFYGQDKVGLQEILDNVDIHGVNQERFKLPPGKEGRTIAKAAVFRILFGGTAWTFANDPEFNHLSKKEKYWQDEVVDPFYDKYKGIAQWHRDIQLEAKATGCLFALSGREYRFRPNERGEWPATTIKNYPVQGGSADAVMLARIAIYRRLIPHKHRGILLINTIHDSVVVDCKSTEVPFVCQTISDVVDELPATISRCFGIDFNIPMSVELEVGPNLGLMTEWRKDAS